MRISRKPAAKYFEDAVSTFEERRGDMVQRQQVLKNKITTMERSLPALMAYNMWVSGKKCADAPLCKVKEIMAAFSPTPDPTDKLLENLKHVVKELNAETEELHGKIIDADIELEETGMELDSLQSVNEDLTEQVAALEHQVQKCTVPSLHSIHSEDLVCLSKIRKLGHEEVNLKCCIRELEEKEVNFRLQMEQLLTSREFQKESGGKKMVKRIQELEATEKKMNCALQTHKYNMHQLKKKLMQKEKEITKMEMCLGINGETKKFMKRNHKSKKDDKHSLKQKGSWLPQWLIPGPSTAADSCEISRNVAEKVACAAGCAADVEVRYKTFEQRIATANLRSIFQPELKKCVCPTPAPIPCYDKPPCKPDASKLKTCCSPGPSTSAAVSYKPQSCTPALRKTLQSPLPSCGKPPSCPPAPPCKPILCPATTLQCPPKVCKPLICPPPSSCCKNNPLCEPPECLESPGCRKPNLPCQSAPSCPYAHCYQTLSCPQSTACPPAPCDTGSICHTCESPTPCKECLPPREPGGCRCSCKGKCARGESSVPCNCSVIPKCSADRGYQPKGLPEPPCGGATGCWLEEDSDDNFCDCCDCGCDDSDESFP